MTNTWLTFENWVVFDVCACVSVPTEQAANDLINSLAMKYQIILLCTLLTAHIL